LETLAGLALSETLGAGADTVTVADCEADPPLPEQASVNFVVAVRSEMLVEPAVDSVPLQPPDAEQDVALVDDQLNVDDAPLLTVLGFAAKVTDGAGVVTDTVTDWVALPPLPVQSSV
jgi:hypothetical protein